MANSVGDDVQEQIKRPCRKIYDAATKFLGSGKTMAKRDVMKSIPDDNPNKKAWEEATKFHGPTKDVSKTKLAQKPPARKRAAAKR
jgi:hypothetical protein